MNNYRVLVVQESNNETSIPYSVDAPTPYKAFNEFVKTNASPLNPNFRYTVSIQNTETEGINLFHITNTMAEEDAISYFDSYIMGEDRS